MSSSSGVEFEGLGKTCTFKGCSVHDYLPVKCSICRGTFCRQHAPEAEHGCSGRPDAVVPTCPLCSQPVALSSPDQSPDLAVDLHIRRGCPPPKSTTSPARNNKCSADGCTRNELVLVQCDVCRKQFCLNHRHPEGHKCTAGGNRLGSTNNNNKSTSSPPPNTSSGARFPAAGRSPAAAAPSAPVLNLRDVQYTNTGTTPVIPQPGWRRDECVVVAVYFPTELGASPTFMALHRGATVQQSTSVVVSHLRGLKGVPATFPFQSVSMFNVRTCEPFAPQDTVGAVLTPGMKVLFEPGSRLRDEVMAQVMQYLQ
eukprot:PhM_4_TR5043/c0_g2_i1/m.76625